MNRLKIYIKLFLNLSTRENEESLEMVIGKLLSSKKSSLSTAESCTGGEIAHLLTSVPGSSDYYRGSVIAYDNACKETAPRGQRRNSEQIWSCK